MNVEKINIEKIITPLSKKEAIEITGKLLVESGFVHEEYIEKMFEREEVVTTYIGNHLAIPHGTDGSQPLILESGISILQTPNGVDFGDGNTVYLLIGIAGKGNDHLDILSKLAISCSNVDTVLKASKLDNKNAVMDLLLGDHE
jgi:PTS system mannitol-specific IIA component